MASGSASGIAAHLLSRQRPAAAARAIQGAGAVRCPAARVRRRAREAQRRLPRHGDQVRLPLPLLLRRDRALAGGKGLCIGMCRYSSVYVIIRIESIGVTYSMQIHYSTSNGTSENPNPALTTVSKFATVTIGNLNPGIRHLHGAGHNVRVRLRGLDAVHRGAALLQVGQRLHPLLWPRLGCEHGRVCRPACTAFPVSTGLSA